MASVEERRISGTLHRSHTTMEPTRRPQSFPHKAVHLVRPLYGCKSLLRLYFSALLRDQFCLFPKAVYLGCITLHILEILFSPPKTISRPIPRPQRPPQHSHLRPHLAMEHQIPPRILLGHRPPRFRRELRAPSFHDRQQSSQ